MTPYEHMVKFEIGIEMGLLTINDLREFLSENLRSGQDVPYIYTDVYLSLNKGHEAVIDSIFYNLRNNYSVDHNAGNTVQRMLIGDIHRKLQNNQIDMEQCVGYLDSLKNYSECGWDLLAINEYYNLMKNGYQSSDEFNEILNRIFALEL